MQQDDECPICMCAFSANKVFFSCTHAFNKKCIQTYCIGKIKNGEDIRCPVCRNMEIQSGSRDYEYLASRLLSDIDKPTPMENVQVIIQVPSAMVVSSSTRNYKFKISNIGKKKIFFVCSVLAILVILVIILFQLNHE